MVRNILYVPLDERPCNVVLPQQLFSAAKQFRWRGQPCRQERGKAPSPTYKVQTIPIDSRKKQPADVDAIFDNLERSARSAAALAASADTLLYGGLLPSRIHHLSSDTLDKRINRLIGLKQANPSLLVYIFVLIMRSPAYNSADEEPDYCESWGADLHRYGAWLHRQSMGLKSLSSMPKIPPEILPDYLARRELNLSCTKKLIDLGAEGVIDCLAIPQDDTAKFSFSSLERSSIIARAEEKGVEIFNHPGADEMGSTLCARLIADLQTADLQTADRQPADLQTKAVLEQQSTTEQEPHNPPLHSSSKPINLSSKSPTIPSTTSFYFLYSNEDDLNTIPLYEDRPLRDSILQQSDFVQINQCDDLQNADALIAFNLPIGASAEAEQQWGRALAPPPPSLIRFAENLASLPQGMPVYLADLRFVNGGDWQLCKLLDEMGMLGILCLYAAWNTCGNTLGTVLSAASLGVSNRDLLRRRLVEDLGYMSAVRAELRTSNFLLPEYSDRSRSAEEQRQKIAEWVKTRLCEVFRSEVPKSTWLHKIPYRIDFPWSRVFEIDLIEKY